jgi:predicted murein hydrolase (TIGR00659 family)
MFDWSAAFWLAITLGGYVLSRMIYKRVKWYVLAPIVFVPAILYLIAIPAGTRYGEYSHYTSWLIGLLGPATVAFAVPIWQQRRLLVRYWQALLAGIAVGSFISIFSSWALARLLALDAPVTLSLLPRSITTPFAMPMSKDLGGVPELTAAFVLVTGVFGAIVGSVLLRFLPLRSALARGAMFGVGAHGAGTSRAYEVGIEEGTVAGLTMVLTGLLNLLGAQLLIWIL